MTGKIRKNSEKVNAWLLFLLCSLHTCTCTPTETDRHTHRLRKWECFRHAQWLVFCVFADPARFPSTLPASKSVLLPSKHIHSINTSILWTHPFCKHIHFVRFRRPLFVTLLNMWLLFSLSTFLLFLVINFLVFNKDNWQFVSVRVCVCVYIYIYIYIHTHYIYTHTYMHTCICTCIYAGYHFAMYWIQVVQKLIFTSLFLLFLVWNFLLFNKDNNMPIHAYIHTRTHFAQKKR